MDMDGHTLTLKLPVDNLDTPLKVYTYSSSYSTVLFCSKQNYGTHWLVMREESEYLLYIDVHPKIIIVGTKLLLSVQSIFHRLKVSI